MALNRLDPSVRSLDQSRLGPVLTGDRRDLGDGPPVTAMRSRRPPVGASWEVRAQTSSTPHQSAMNSAAALVVRRIDSSSTASSKPWMLRDVGP